MAKYQVIRPHRVGDQILREGIVELKPEHAEPHVKAGHLQRVAEPEAKGDAGDGGKGKGR